MYNNLHIFVYIYIFAYQLTYFAHCLRTIMGKNNETNDILEESNIITPRTGHYLASSGNAHVTQ